jgi:hypothetical protein
MDLLRIYIKNLDSQYKPEAHVAFRRFDGDFLAPGLGQESDIFRAAVMNGSLYLAFVHLDSLDLDLQ